MIKFLKLSNILIKNLNMGKINILIKYKRNQIKSKGIK